MIQELPRDQFEKANLTWASSNNGPLTSTLR